MMFVIPHNHTYWNYHDTSLPSGLNPTKELTNWLVSYGVEPNFGLLTDNSQAPRTKFLYTVIKDPELATLFKLTWIQT